MYSRSGPRASRATTGVQIPSALQQPTVIASGRLTSSSTIATLNMPADMASAQSRVRRAIFLNFAISYLAARSSGRHARYRPPTTRIVVSTVPAIVATTLAILAVGSPARTTIESRAINPATAPIGANTETMTLFVFIPPYTSRFAASVSKGGDTTRRAQPLVVLSW